MNSHGSLVVLLQVYSVFACFDKQGRALFQVPEKCFDLRDFVGLQ